MTAATRLAWLARVTIGAGVFLLLAPPAELDAQAPPAPPEDLQADVTTERVRLTWEAGEADGRRDAAFYRIYRDGTRIGGSSDEDYDDAAIAIGATYVYRVSGVDFLGREGELSDPLEVEIVDATPPTVPDGVTASSPSPSRISVRWDASADSETSVAGYYVYRNGSSTPVDSVGTTAYNDTGLSAWTVYSYRVSAINVSGVESARSASVATRTRDGTPPSTPDGLTAEGVSAGEIRLEWNAATDPESGVDGYNVYRNGGSSPVATTTGTSYVDSGLSGTAIRSYEVAAVNGQGLVGARSTSAEARPVDSTPPTAPGGFTAAATGARIVELAWDAASDPESGIERYLVYRGGAIIDSTLGRTYVDTSVEPENSYSYRVSARNGEGIEGPASETAIVTTPREIDFTPPSAPGAFTAQATGPTRVELTWDPATDDESGITLYRVYRDDTLLGTSPGVGFADLTAEAETTYEYEVSAINGEGAEGPRAAAVTVTTPGAAGDTIPPAPPSNLRVVAE